MSQNTLFRICHGPNWPESVWRKQNLHTDILTEYGVVFQGWGYKIEHRPHRMSPSRQGISTAYCELTTNQPTTCAQFCSLSLGSPSPDKPGKTLKFNMWPLIFKWGPFLQNWAQTAQNVAKQAGHIDSLLRTDNKSAYYSVFCQDSRICPFQESSLSKHAIPYLPWPQLARVSVTQAKSYSVRMSVWRFCLRHTDSGQLGPWQIRNSVFWESICTI
jgi:hypothetical protein